MAVLEVVQHTFGQTELRDAVAQHAADLIVAFKNSHIVAVAGQDDRDGQTSRAAADDGGLFAVGGGGTFGHLAGVGRGNVVLDDREMHRCTLDALHAVALALVLVVAHQRADGGQGVILKQHLAGVVQFVILQQADDLGDVGVDGAALLAAGLFASKAMVGFIHYMQCHGFFSFYEPILPVKNATILQLYEHFSICILYYHGFGRKGKSHRLGFDPAKCRKIDSFAVQFADFCGLRPAACQVG